MYMHYRYMYMYVQVCVRVIDTYISMYLDVPDPLGPQRQRRDVPLLVLPGPVPRAPRLVEELHPHFNEHVVLQIFLFLQKKMKH